MAFLLALTVGCRSGDQAASRSSRGERESHRCSALRVPGGAATACRARAPEAHPKSEKRPLESTVVRQGQKRSHRCGLLNPCDLLRDFHRKIMKTTAFSSRPECFRTHEKAPTSDLGSPCSVHHRLLPRLPGLLRLLELRRHRLVPTRGPGCARVNRSAARASAPITSPRVCAPLLEGRYIRCFRWR